jgi:hypothetical protein
MWNVYLFIFVNPGDWWPGQRGILITKKDFWSRTVQMTNCPKQLGSFVSLEKAKEYADNEARPELIFVE